MERTAMPISAYFTAWGACLEAELCDKVLAKAYICQQATAFDRFRQASNKALQLGETSVNVYYRKLVAQCGNIPSSALTKPGFGRAAAARS